MATKLDEQAIPGGSSFSAGGITTIKMTTGGALAAWEITSPGPPFRGSYGLNVGLFTSPPAGFQPRILGGRNPPLGLDTLSLKGTSGIPAILDSALPIGNPEWSMTPSSDGFRRGGMWPFCMKRHDTYVNGLFLDWSARRIDLKELWVLRWYPGFNTSGHWTEAGGVKAERWPKWMRGLKDY